MTNTTQTVLGGTKQIWLGKEFPIGWRSLVYVYTKTYNRIQIQNMSAKTMQTATTIWPVLCYTGQQLG
jgi:hypothetical protein